MKQLLQSGQLVSEYGFVRKDGSTFTAEVSTRLFTEGSRRFVFCNVRDVTHRKEMEQQLRESEERYRAIFNTAADGIVLTRLDKITLGNEQMERLFRVAPGGLLGRTITEFSPEFQPDGRRSEDAFAYYFDEVQRGGTVEFEWDHKLSDGTAIRAWIRLRGVEIGSERYVIAVVRDVTEREQDRRRLQESEKALRDAQSLAKLGSWSLSVNYGEVLAASDEMYRLYNTTPEQSRKIEDRLGLIHPGDRERVVAALKEATEGTYELEYRAMVDGKVRWMYSRADVVHDESVGGLVAHGTTQDITELKRAQREAEQAQGQLDSILQSVPVGIGILEDDRIKWASAGLARITNRPAESLVGATLDTVLSPEDMGRFAELRSHSDADNPLEAMQARLYTGDSIRRWVQIGVAPLHSPEGNGDTYTISMADISDLREAEEKIRELSAAVENAPVSIFITDLDGRIQYVNPWVQKVTGYTAEELIGQNPRIFKSDETPAEQYTHLWESLLSGKNWHGDFHNKRKDGELFWERATISPILRESDGEPFRYIAIKQDITEAKRIEEELRRHQNELEDIVQSRTTELVEARNVALEADRLKSTFLASVSHELRTPLTSVIGFAEVLKEQSYGTLNDKQWEYVNHVLSSGRKLLEVINDILDLSRLDAGRMELECRQFTLPTLITHCIENVSATSDKNVAIEEVIDQNLWLRGVVADERKIRQVLLNLLTNAVTYTPEDGKITVRALIDNDTVRIAVADTGVGIPSEYLEEIFETFRQLNKDEFRHSKGTGLGLALTRRIIELHGGRAWAESDGPGLGSTFYVEFPLRSEKVAEPMGA